MARSAGSMLRLALASSFAASLMGACSGEGGNPAAPAQDAPSADPVVLPEMGQENVVQEDGSAGLATNDATAQEGATTLCGAQEAQIFSCKVRGGKIASVCLARGAAGEFAQYRFGRAGAAPELVWPNDASEQMQWASVPYSGGGETQLSFAIGDVRYVVYSKIVRTNFTPGETNDPAITDGLAVLRSGTIEAQFACDGNDLRPVDVNAARTHLAKADDLFTYETD